MGVALEFCDVSFSYCAVGGMPGASVLDGASFAVPEGAFALLVGDTGSGKSTILRLSKPELAPQGNLRGCVRVLERIAKDYALEDSAQLIGMVLQDPAAQAVCDSVWHEMAFGLENLGMSQAEMGRRIAETCTYLGMGSWFDASVAELSGGQLQILALASVLAMRPRILLLDEPTSMLDPIVERQYLSLLFRANRELGITIVVATHAPRAFCDYATMALEVRQGHVCEVPLEGLVARDVPGSPVAVPQDAKEALAVREAWYRYGREFPWVLRDVSLALVEGDSLALVGGNGCGKSTLLSLLAGLSRPQHGRMKKRLKTQALLPQSPRAIFKCETVFMELSQWSGADRLREVEAALVRIGLENARERHPLDLSGGQQQLLALEKVLLTKPQLLLLDEPTKGLDGHMRSLAADELRRAVSDGATLVVATHDLAFARAVTHWMALLFDGRVAADGPTGEFLDESWLWRM